jgi:tRNA pseudouridine32 synthase/23S rRNA pseudouridine746 synthase
MTPSRVRLPPGGWATVLDFLCERFARIDRATWRDRMARGRVLDDAGLALAPERAYQPGLRVTYFREVADEATVAEREVVVHLDDHLVVVDKPHFLAVVPGGDRVADTLVARIAARLGVADVAPLHRLDRHTAGLVMLSIEPASRAAYHALFRERRIDKRYECLAPPLPDLAFPHTRRSRLGPGEPFFRIREIEGTPDSESRVEVLERGGTTWRYGLVPVTGRKHQLRVHMAALGAPIEGDPYYPELRAKAPDDPRRPLRLVARALAFVDPLSGAARRFASERRL